MVLACFGKCSAQADKQSANNAARSKRGMVVTPGKLMRDGTTKTLKWARKYRDVFMMDAPQMSKGIKWPPSKSSE
jgi:hypothetical protein